MSSPAAVVRRRWPIRALVVLLLALVPALGLAFARPAQAATTPGGTSRAEALAQLQVVQRSIDQTLALLEQGQRQQAFEVAKTGYLDHYEAVEIPLRVADPGLTLRAEEQFAIVRGLISNNAPTETIRPEIVTLRQLVVDSERRLTAKGVAAPAAAVGQGFVILFREGLEAVLLLSVLIGYLEKSRNRRLVRPLLAGVGVAVAASAVTYLAIDALIAVLPFGREVLEAAVALLAVAVLFYVSFWLVARLDRRRWLEFLRARAWTAASAGSATGLILVGFTSIFREGFETALFYAALASFAEGLRGWVALGAGLAAVALGVVVLLVFRFGRRLPVGTFLTVAVALLMATSVAVLGNAVNALQTATLLPFSRLDGWPRLPIFLAQMTGYTPTVQTVLAQAGLAAVYLAGAGWLLWAARRRRRGAASAGADRTPARPAGPTADPAARTPR